MAISKDVLDELMKNYKGPDDITGPDGLIKQLSKALIERAMQAELTDQLGYEKHDPGNKSTENRRNGTSKKRLRSDQCIFRSKTASDSGDKLPPPKCRIPVQSCHFWQESVAGNDRNPVISCH
jgi:hypothetical protein